MHPIKIFFTLFLILFIHALGQSQSGYRACYGFDCKEEKWSFSVFTGFSLMGPAKGTYDQMKVAGLNSVRPAQDSIAGSGGRSVYPQKRTGIVWNLEAGYTISRRSGLLLSVGKSYQSTVKGYQNIGNGNSLELNSQLWSVSFNYLWRIGKGNGGLNIGPVTAWYKVGEVYPGQSDNGVTYASTFKPGVNVGYTLPLVKKKSWFLTFKTNYTWLPEAEIGPYTSSHTLYYGTSNQEVHTSTFGKSKINLSTINIGLSTGWRF